MKKKLARNIIVIIALITLLMGSLLPALMQL